MAPRHLPPATTDGDVLTLDSGSPWGVSWVTPTGGGGGGAPTGATYVVRTATALLSAERVLADSASITWDWSVAGQVTGTVPDATTTSKGIVELATSVETTAGLVVQASDTRLSDARAPTGAASGDLGGTYPSPTVAAVTETSGPTQLVLGAIAAGQWLIRSGATLIGSALPVASTILAGIVQFATSGSATAGRAVEATDSRLSDSRAPTGAAGGDLSGTYPNPAVAKITETSGPTSLTIGSIADGKTLVRSGSTVVGGGGYAPVYVEASSTTTSLAGGVAITGATFSLTAGAKYIIEGWGRYVSGASGVSIRFNLVGSGGLSLTQADVVLRAQNSATAEQPSYTNALSALTGGTAGANVNSPWSFGGYIQVNAGGTLDIHVATEIGGTNVTLSYGVFRLTRYA